MPATQVVESVAPKAVEFPARIIYGLVRPAVRIARRFGLTLDDVVRLVEMAYIDELRQVEGLTHEQIARAIGKSKRTVGYLLQRYHQTFLQPDEDVAALRRVEAAILGGKRTLEHIEASVTEDDRRHLPALLRKLSHTGRIRRLVSNGVEHYGVSDRMSSWVTADIAARIDALNHQMQAIASTIWSRFVLDDSATSVARTYSIRTSPERVTRMIQELVRILRAACIEAEEDVPGADKPRNYMLTFAVAPEIARGSDP